MDIGQVCVKIAGRDAGKTCVIVELLEHGFALVDGNTRRRKTNLSHLEALDKTVDISEGASTEEVKKAMSKAGLKVVEKKKRTKTGEKKTQSPRKRLSKQIPAATEKTKKAKK